MDRFLRIISLILCLCFFMACSQLDESLSLPERIDGYSLILNTSKFSCYQDSNASIIFLTTDQGL